MSAVYAIRRSVCYSRPWVGRGGFVHSMRLAVRFESAFDAWKFAIANSCWVGSKCRVIRLVPASRRADCPDCKGLRAYIRKHAPVQKHAPRGAR